MGAIVAVAVAVGVAVAVAVAVGVALTPGVSEGVGLGAIVAVAVAVAFGVDQLIFHSQNIIVMRDPASYINFGNWISKHGSLPIPENRDAVSCRTSS